MLRSMFSGVSGLRSHQTMMDVIGNNIANVNTVGYKAGSVVFQDLLSQMTSGPGVPALNVGGRNVAQVGLGVRIGGIVTSFTQGSAQLTGRSTDLSIQGDGFFVVQQQGETLYTRGGSLTFDGLGRLVTPSGGILQGWVADGAGNVNTNAATGSFTLPLGQTTAPNATTSARVGGNLNADAAVGTRVAASITVYDQQGTPHDVTVTFTKAAGDTWTAEGRVGNAVVMPPRSLAFDPGTGRPAAPVPALVLSGMPGQWGGGAITLDLAGADGLTQFTGASSASALSQNGSAMGTLQSFTVGTDGVVNGVFSNGTSRAVGQIALATFTNPPGLEKVGGSLYRGTPNSGLAQVGVAGAVGRGTLSGGTLEMSNVDLAQEFTNLIVAQRGFQANSRVITSSDELLQDLVNLKR
jgi:flagellar hook protein FlgE